MAKIIIAVTASKSRYVSTCIDISEGRYVPTLSQREKNSHLTNSYWQISSGSFAVRHMNEEHGEMDTLMFVASFLLLLNFWGKTGNFKISS
jgi:hypothetical protein